MLKGHQHLVVHLGKGEEATLLAGAGGGHARPVALLLLVEPGVLQLHAAQAIWVVDVGDNCDRHALHAVGGPGVGEGAEQAVWPSPAHVDGALVAAARRELVACGGDQVGAAHAAAHALQLHLRARAQGRVAARLGLQVVVVVGDLVEHSLGELVGLALRANGLVGNVDDGGATEGALGRTGGAAPVAHLRGVGGLGCATHDGALGGGVPAAHLHLGRLRHRRLPRADGEQRLAPLLGGRLGRRALGAAKLEGAVLDHEAVAHAGGAGLEEGEIGLVVLDHKLVAVGGTLYVGAQAGLAGHAGGDVGVGLAQEGAGLAAAMQAMGAVVAAHHIGSMALLLLGLQRRHLADQQGARAAGGVGGAQLHLGAELEAVAVDQVVVLVVEAQHKHRRLVEVVLDHQIDQLIHRLGRQVAAIHLDEDLADAGLLGGHRTSQCRLQIAGAASRAGAGR